MGEGAAEGGDEAEAAEAEAEAEAEATAAATKGPLRLVSSQRTASAVASTLAARGDRSSRLPMGVATM